MNQIPPLPPLQIAPPSPSQPSQKTLATLDDFYREVRGLFDDYKLDQWVQVEVLNKFPADCSPNIRYHSIRRFLKEPGNLSILYGRRLRQEFPEVLQVQAVTLNQTLVEVDRLLDGKSPKVQEGIRIVRETVKWRLDDVRNQIRERERAAREVRRG